MKPLRIAIAGLGTVGGGVIDATGARRRIERARNDRTLAEIVIALFRAR